jgi:molybdopterin-biosynthesis enzyme MoeA-like protein
MLVDYYRDPAEVTEARAKMALIPAGAVLVVNPVSGAPGFKTGNVYTFAGVPRIMQAMFDSIRAELHGGKPVMSGTVACDLAESVIASGLSAIQAKWPDVDIGSYPTYRGGAVGLSVVVRALDEAMLDSVMEEVVALVGALGGTPLAISKDTPKAD